ncbi:hypothetical protein KPL40_15880 [Clostridium gasigenes]|uniref:hypothetical protein n=1 Tax=Clostridium gasigenes TaxID=94869 RepID=UPI001C0D7FA5|nr:hypothetical protein [Clostridium gasigenes]MBU3133909.1 hypothetical protein [Clostridium gasigenes]
MATYVLMLKEYEDNEIVIFKFGPNKTAMGKVEINKITKEYREIEAVPKVENKFYYNCTVSKLIRYLSDNKGKEFPERMFYAS